MVGLLHFLSKYYDLLNEKALIVKTVIAVNARPFTSFSPSNAKYASFR